MLAELAGMDGVIVVIVIAVVLFGGSQIPKFARSLGSAHTEFKKGLAEGSAGGKDASKDAAVEPAKVATPEPANDAAPEPVKIVVEAVVKDPLKTENTDTPSS
jgi:sec-independent protein translocase protein TatA